MTDKLEEPSLPWNHNRRRKRNYSWENCTQSCLQKACHLMRFHDLCAPLQGRFCVTSNNLWSANEGNSIGTGVTFKQGTREEAKKPWHPMQQQNKQERLYWLDDKTYRPLDGDAWSSIERGAAKLWSNLEVDNMPLFRTMWWSVLMQYFECDIDEYLYSKQARASCDTGQYCLNGTVCLNMNNTIS